MMKTVIWLSFFGVGTLAHPSGLWWGTDQCFPSPENTDNQCLEPQQTGFDWSDLANSDNWSYEGFNFVGFAPSNACGSSGGKCIEARLSRDDNYAIKVEATQAPFSVSNLHLSTSRDTMVILNYEMADGSKCRQLAWSSPAGADITNEQCGDAVAVEFTLPEDSKFGECDLNIHRMDFDCSTGPKPPTEMPPPPHSTQTDSETTSCSTSTHSTSWTQPPTTTSAPPESWTTSTVYTTEEITITSCAPTVTNCPTQSTTVITSTYVASTTVCPLAPTNAPPRSTSMTSTSPDVPETSIVPAPCPDLVPKCLNTWLSVPKCDSNSDAACFCPSSEFTEKVTTCIHSWGKSENEVNSALSYFAGICAPYVPSNPKIIDIVPPPSTSAPEEPHHTVTGPVPGMTSPPEKVTAPVPGMTSPPDVEITPAPEAPHTPCTTMTWSSRTVTAPLVEFSTIPVGTSSSVALVPGTTAGSHEMTNHRTCSTTMTTSTSHTTASKTTTCLTHAHKPTETIPLSNGGSRVSFPSMWAFGVVFAVMWLK